MYADISAQLNSRPMTTDKTVASAAALAEVDAVVVVLALVRKYPKLTVRAVGLLDY
jgi:hypothetical protein